MKQPQKALCIATIKHNTFPIDQYTHRPLHCTSNSGSEAVLPSLHSPSWNLPSSTVESILSSPCSRSDLPSLAKMRLSLTLTFSRLTICYFKQTALFHFLLAKAALSYLPTVLSVALGPLFRSQGAQYAQVFPFCKLFAGLGSTNKSAAVLFLSDSRHSLWQELSFLFPCFIGLQWVPEHLFLPENDAADEVARGGALLLQSLIVSLILSRIGGVRTVSSKFFDTQILLISTEKLVLLRHACCIFPRLGCNGHSLLLRSLID